MKFWQTVDGVHAYETRKEYARDAKRLATLEKTAESFGLFLEEDHAYADGAYHAYYVEIPSEDAERFLTAAVGAGLAGAVVDADDEAQADLIESLGFEIGDIGEDA